MSDALRIVCAANRYGGDLVIPSARHYDLLMHRVIAGIGIGNLPVGEEQGFIDNRGAFHSRIDAYVIAKGAGQIRHKTGNPDIEILYSEDLY